MRNYLKFGQVNEFDSLISIKIICISKMSCFHIGHSLTSPTMCSLFTRSTSGYHPCVLVFHIGFQLETHFSSTSSTVLTTSSLLRLLTLVWTFFVSSKLFLYTCQVILSHLSSFFFCHPPSFLRLTLFFLFGLQCGCPSCLDFQWRIPCSFTMCSVSPIYLKCCSEVLLFFLFFFF